MAFTKVIAPAKTAETKIMSAKDARDFFKRSDVHFPDGCQFSITDYQVVQFCKPGETVPSPSARRHIVFVTPAGELNLSALYSPKQKLDISDLQKAPETIYPNGSFTKFFDELIDASNGDIEELVSTNIDKLKALKLKARRVKFYGIDIFGNKNWMTQLNIDIVE